MIKAGLDIGNSKISAIVCDQKSDGSIKVLSFISNPTNNVKRNIITNLSSLKEEISIAISEVAKSSETEIKSINLNIPAVESYSLYSESEVKIDGEMVNDLHIKKAINESNILEPIDNYEVIQSMILGYELDKKLLFENPSGTYGDELNIKFYNYAVKKNIINTFVGIFDKLNIHIENFIPTPLASSLSTLNQDDKILGCICIDLGASSSSVSIFENEKIIFMDGINIGGRNITNDIARGLSTNLESAERLKTLYGSVISSPSDEYEVIEVPYLNNDISKFKQINRSSINSIIKPRVEETLELIWQKLKEYNLHKKYIKNLVLTGGGSLLEGVAEYAQIIFDSNVRLGKPLPIPGLEENFLKPQFSQTIGTILYHRPNYEIEFLKKRDNFEKKGIFRQFSSWLDKYI
tara:strand:- start:87 stop:1307 length:1221 start_codon:yes stop_codon:yes gene_type:complete